MASRSERHEADTIEALAEEIGVPADALVKTVARYNELAEMGIDLDYGKGANHLHTIAEPPFIAYKEAYYIFGMSSGVKVNKKLQVVDKNWDPIPGLFAAGNCVGWRIGSGYQNAIPGLCNAYAAVHGYFAGKNAATGDVE
ncbi:MAG: FAD-binding protein [Coriobacteriales bacterium]|nr:FAD-binding protein [Coriobacteriales bacterium]